MTTSASAPYRVESPSRATLVLLGVLTAVGAALRFYGLGRQSFWNDELFSVVVSLHAPDEIPSLIQGDGHPPGFQWLLWASLRWFGNTEVAARLPSAAAGTLAVPAMFLLGRRLYGDREGIVAAGMFAVGWIPVWFAQEARAYSLLILAIVLAAWGWLGLVGNLPRRRLHATVLVLAGLTAAWVHYFGLLAVALLGAASLGAVVTGRAAPRLLVPFGLVVVGYLPWLGGFLHDLRHAKHPEIGAPKNVLRAMRRQVRFLFEAKALGRAVFAVLGAGVASHLVRFRLRAWRSVGGGTWFLLAWFAGTILVVWVQSKVSTPVFTERNLLITLPAVFLLVARAATTSLPWPAARSVIPIALVVAMAFQLIGAGYFITPRKQQWREAVEAVVAGEADGGAVLVFGHAWDMEYFNYYFDRSGSRLRAEPLPPPAALGQRVASERPDRVWVIWGHRDPPAEARQALTAAGFRVARDLPLVGAGAWFFVADGVVDPGSP